jgi:chromosome segregation ATPase
MGSSVSSKTEMELERVNALLEQSREEQRALSEQMDGKEAAWERLVSAKESYALRVQEKDDKIRQLKQSLEQSRNIAENLQKSLREKDVGMARATMSEAMEQQHLKVIERLDNRIRQIQQDMEENTDQHEIKLRENTAQIEQLRKQLTERDETTATLERECSDLRQAGMETVRVCENSIEQVKNAHATELMQKENQIRHLQNMLSDIQACQTPTAFGNYPEEDAENSPCRRLERQLDLTTSELDRERRVIKSMATEIDQLKDEIKRLHRVSVSSSSDFYSLRMELESEIQDKRRIMEESNAALQKQARLEEENERIRLNSEKSQHDLAEVLKKLATMEKQRAGKNDYQQYHYQLENLQRQNQLLEQENESMQDAQKQTEHECMRLMDELLAFEKVESETTDSKKDERVLRREIEQLRSQISRERKRYADLEQSKNTKLEKLNKELSDLESLVENKVFSETDLEKKLENEKNKVRQLEAQLVEEQEKIEKGLCTPMSPTSPKSQPLFRQNRSSTTSTLVTNSSIDTISNDELEKEYLYCEICESYGHEVISCTALANMIPKESYLSDMNENSCVS